MKLKDLSGPDFSNIVAQAPPLQKYPSTYTSSPLATTRTYKVSVLDKEPRYFERGVKEAIYIRAYKPSLNKDGGRYKLPDVYDPVIDRHFAGKVNHPGHSADEGCSDS